MTAALRTVLRGPLWRCAVFVASFLLAYAMWPHPVRYTQQAAGPDPLAAAQAEHDCGDTPAPGRTLLLVRWPDGSVSLPVWQPPGMGATGERWADQYDWLDDRDGEFYGWCTP